MPFNSSAIAIANLKEGFPGFNLPGAGRMPGPGGGVRGVDVSDAMNVLRSEMGPEVDVGNGPSPQSTFNTNTGQPIVQVPRSGRGPRAGRGPLTVDPSFGTRANPAGSEFNSVAGGYVPAGVPSFNGTPSVYPTTWTNDAGLGWVPRAQPAPQGSEPSDGGLPDIGAFANYVNLGVLPGGGGGLTRLLLPELNH